MQVYLKQGLVMLTTVSHPLFAQSIVNPLTEGTSYDVDLRLTNSRDRINLIKDGVGFQTKYLLVLNPDFLGCLSSNQDIANLFMENLVLAMNLQLQHTTLSTMEADLASPQMEFEQLEPKMLCKDRPTEKHVHGVLTLKGAVYVTRKCTEEIDEDKLFNELELINKVNLHKFSNDAEIKLVTLGKTLTEYKNAMQAHDRLAIFEHLFLSLGFATNWDRDRTGKDFDYEVARTTGVQVSTIEGWRKFFNRARHVDTKPEDIMTFIEGMKNLPSLLMPLRFAAKIAITDRLKKL